MLEAENLKRVTARRHIVNDVSLFLGAGEIGALLGPSGSGKSSFLRLVMGLDTLDGGRVSLDGRTLAGDGLHIPPERRGMSMVFQDFTLFPHLSVQENLTFGKKRADIDLDGIVDMLEIAHLTRRSIGTLSGGEQQRVAIARSLASGPKLLLLDEPFSNIDNMLKERLYDRVLGYLRHTGITAILATHDHNEAFFFSDRMFVMKDGSLIDSNSPEGIYRSPASHWVAEFFGTVNVLSEKYLAQLGKTVPPGQYLVRPEMLEVAPSGMSATLELSTFFGFYRDLKATSEHGQELRLRVQEAGDLQVGDRFHIRLRNGAEPHRLEAEKRRT